MAEYIEREEALKILMDMRLDYENSDCPVHALCEDYVNAIETVKDKLNMLIAANVRPGRHGRWSDNMVSYMDDFNGDMHIGFQCSECKAILNKTKYCGNCGAKMDGKDSENDVHTM